MLTAIKMINTKNAPLPPMAGGCSPMIPRDLALPWRNPLCTALDPCPAPDANDASEDPELIASVSLA